MSPKRHHYVPAWYQTRFACEVDGKRMLYVYDKDFSEEPPRLQQPKNTAVEGRLYSFKDNEDREISIEEAFAELENIVQPIIERWLHPTEQPSDEEIGVMAFFVGHMLGRSPRTINADAEIQSALVVSTMRNLAKNPSRQAEAFHTLKAEGKLPGTNSLEELQELLDNFEKRFTVKPDRKYAMAQSISVSHELGELLMDMKWCLFVAPSDAFFITSDCPVNLVFFPARGQAGFGGGLIHPTAQVSFPLSPQISVIIDHKTNQYRRRVSKKVVTEMNRRQVANAERFIYSHLNTSEIRGWVRKFTYTRSRPRIDKEIIIRRFETELSQNAGKEA